MGGPDPSHMRGIRARYSPAGHFAMCPQRGTDTKPLIISYTVGAIARHHHMAIEMPGRVGYDVNVLAA